jgi:hypothetical protein
VLKQEGVMPKSGILFALLVLLGGVSVGLAQDDVGARMSLERIATIRTGTYAAGDQIRFSLDRYAAHYLLRFDNEPEIYVVYADHGSLGGQVLKYDSGATALKVAGWGAITLYTDSQPSGLPAERTGDSMAPVLAQISLSAMQGAAEDEAEHLSYVRRLHLSFTADWPALAADPGLRLLAFDTMQNTARGIDRFAANGAARAALAAKIDTVRIMIGAKPTLELHGRVLNVTFNPSQGFAGRASSRGIARALGKLLSATTVN